MGWNVAPCQAPGCALAANHDGDHRSAEGIEKHERGAGLWRVLFLVGLAAVAYYLVNGLPG